MHLEANHLSIDGASAVPPGLRGPQRIVCLTEETTEWLYLLGEERRIVGISGFTMRPRRARLEKPKVSAFTSARIDQIVALRPDLVIGFSDIQADIAAALIRAGVAVLVFNQRSVAQIFEVLAQVAALVGASARGEALLLQYQEQLARMEQAVAARLAQGARRPRVYFEEWDDPPISAIGWVSELIHVAGGEDCFAERAQAPLARDRIIADPLEVARRAPDLIIGSWCGKKFRPEKVAARPGWQDVPAVRDGALHEIKSVDILQPGPAALTDGAARLHRIIMNWMEHQAPTLPAAQGALPPERAHSALGRPGGGVAHD